MSESTALVHVPKAPPKKGDVNEWGRRFDGRFWCLDGEAEDRIPETFEGSPIPPNKFCRSWNAKEFRQKYCRQLAGYGTDHPGEGRCRFHGGNSPVVHGLRRRYKAKSQSIAKIIEDLEADQKPYEILEEIQLARALLQKHLEDNDDPNHELTLRYTTEIGRMVERVFTMRSKMAITHADLKQLLFNIDRKQEAVIRKLVKDSELADMVLTNIREELSELRV